MGGKPTDFKVHLEPHPANVVDLNADKLPQIPKAHNICRLSAA